MKVAVFGASGFVGGAISADLESRAFKVTKLRAPRIVWDDRQNPGTGVLRYRSLHSDEFLNLVDSLAGTDVVVNAAGLAEPDSGDRPGLLGANGVLPAVLAAAAAEAGVRRLIHVSSAAVQGAAPVLTESPNTAPFSPYSASKALGERLLSDTDLPKPEEVTIYRPTSVQGAGRSMTTQLVRFARLPIAPMCADGEQPLPLALVENVAAAATHLACVPQPPIIAVHPWEGMTTRRMLDLFGARRMVGLPAWVFRSGCWGLQKAGQRFARASAIARRIELLAFGQNIDATGLAQSGFIPPIGPDGYRTLAEHVARKGGC